MKKILLLTAILVAALTVNAWAAADDDVDVSVTVEETCAVCLTNDPSAFGTPPNGFSGDTLTMPDADNVTAPDPTLEDYINGSYTVSNSDNSLMWWTNQAAGVHFSVDVDTTGAPGAGSTVLTASTMNFAGPLSFGEGGIYDISAGTGTLASTGYTLSDISLDGSDDDYLPPGDYVVTFTVECGDPSV
jgi:hypothetical protein